MWIVAKEVNSLANMFWQTLEENEHFMLQQAKSLSGIVSSFLSNSEKTEAADNTNNCSCVAVLQTKMFHMAKQVGTASC